MARTDTVWRCSQCGTVNEAGSRACSNCGKWPSLFDLQDSVDVQAEAEGAQAETFEPELFEPETFEPETFEPQPYETVAPVPEAVEPEVSEREGEGEGRSRFPRWAITVIWVTALVVWLVANALTDRG